MVAMSPEMVRLARPASAAVARALALEFAPVRKLAAILRSSASTAPVGDRALARIATREPMARRDTAHNTAAPDTGKRKQVVECPDHTYIH